MQTVLILSGWLLFGATLIGLLRATDEIAEYQVRERRYSRIVQGLVRDEQDKQAAARRKMEEFWHDG